MFKNSIMNEILIAKRLANRIKQDLIVLIDYFEGIATGKLNKYLDDVLN